MIHCDRNHCESKLIVYWGDWLNPLEDLFLFVYHSLNLFELLRRAGFIYFFFSIVFFISNLLLKNYNRILSRNINNVANIFFYKIQKKKKKTDDNWTNFLKPTDQLWITACISSIDKLATVRIKAVLRESMLRLTCPPFVIQWVQIKKKAFF